MSRKGLGAVVVVASLAIPVSAASAPPRDFTTGGGETAVGTHIGFAAHQNSKDGATGHATIKNKTVGTERKGHVVCINAVGNRAIFTIRNQKQADAPGEFETFLVEDNGKPQNGQPVDRIRETNPPDPTCDPSRLGEMQGMVLMKGNINVHDGG